jgi:hypothetical protein
VPRAQAFLRLADNAFNFGVRGRAGFDELVRMVDGCACWDLVFGDLGAAAALVERAAASGDPCAEGRGPHASLAAS